MVPPGFTQMSLTDLHAPLMSTSTTVAFAIEPLIVPFLKCISVLLYFSITFFWQQAFLKRTDVGGLVRMELQPAALQNRWADGTAPYCMGATPTATSQSLGYDFPVAYLAITVFAQVA